MEKLTTEKFDDAMGEETTPIIWTAAQIGRRIGRSAAYVRRTLSRAEGTPVRRIGRGNLYAVEAELLEFWEKRRT